MSCDFAKSRGPFWMTLGDQQRVILNRQTMLVKTMSKCCQHYIFRWPVTSMMSTGTVVTGYHWCTVRMLEISITCAYVQRTMTLHIIVPCKCPSFGQHAFELRCHWSDDPFLNKQSIPNTIDSRYIAVEYGTNAIWKEKSLNVEQNMISENTPYTSRLRAIYGASFLRSL